MVVAMLSATDWSGDPDPDTNGITRAAGQRALSRAAELDAKMARLDAERRATAREKKVAAQRRGRMAKNLHGFDDDEVIEIVGMRAILKERATAKRNAQADRAVGRCPLRVSSRLPLVCVYVGNTAAGEASGKSAKKGKKNQKGEDGESPP
jgi:hypothetical protein